MLGDLELEGRLHSICQEADFHIFVCPVSANRRRVPEQLATGNISRRTPTYYKLYFKAALLPFAIPSYPPRSQRDIFLQVYVRLLVTSLPEHTNYFHRHHGVQQSIRLPKPTPRCRSKPSVLPIFLRHRPSIRTHDAFPGLNGLWLTTRRRSPGLWQLRRRPSRIRWTDGQCLWSNGRTNGSENRMARSIWHRRVRARARLDARAWRQLRAHQDKSTCEWAKSHPLLPNPLTTRSRPSQY